ncbi:hypothetical protein E4634_19670 [Mangrovimicrobium sediminis]|uniref:PEP-CTERM sorting domain-containing protein n=1 Tax=Mangrovimicrobium sediminis TaxID=2562682 RepID=A0A4Z0LVB4_9GAMM|nr:hypothetical protein [Haliea sp. SAOS-164]TGD71068.1 hypothetical protein E4634_19670 [Haliea sp. SAOS-164]
MKTVMNRKRLACALFVGVSSFVAGPALAGLDQGDAVCVGENLEIALEITLNSNLYRVNGTGPNLPSASIAYPGSFTFAIDGPGDWSGMILEYSSDGGTNWSESYREVLPDAISCVAAAPVPPAEPVPALGTPALLLLVAGLFGAARRRLRKAKA